MNRLERLVNILIHLQSKRIIKAQELADKFDISLRTVYRDVAALELAGVPILSEAGIGYSLLKGYNLPPLQITDKEVTAFFTAGKLLQMQAEEEISRNFESGMTKIKAILNFTEKERVNDLSDKLKVLSNPYLPTKVKSSTPFNSLLEAILGKKLVQFSYQGVHDVVPIGRTVEPIGIYALANNWYLIAWCKVREDYRTFRFDRVSDFEIINSRFENQHPELEDFVQKLHSEKGLTKVVISVDIDSYHYVGDEKYYQGFVSELKFENRVEMTFLTGSLEGFSHWFLLLGSEADILIPKELNEMVITKAENVIKRVAQQ